MVVLTELLPGSSSSSSSTNNQDHRYDVFLSFRGVDTRNGFTDHLYNSLVDANIITFLDDEEIETGEQLKPELESAIKSSRASIIVLSKNYASSTWCLDELVLILEQHEFFNQIAIPIFYHVEPTDVRKQQKSFEEAMEKHKHRMETETNVEKRTQMAQKLVSWKMALTQVADLKGKDAKDRKETEFIEEVVTEIHRRLGVLLSNTLPHLIGVDHHIRSISSWLNDGSCHIADILTVVGISGIGKTSLARYVFGLHSGKFHKSSFIEGINTRCKEKFNGLLDLQKQLYGDISKKIPLQVNDVCVYTSKIENALAHRMVFLVLDDIQSLDELDALLGKKGFHPGSKIIITSKDASLTERCALFNPHVQPKHKTVSLDGLHRSESLELLCIHAFKSQYTKEGYEDVSEELVKYCKGHPLALEVLGRSLHKQDVADWKDCIKVLNKEPHSRINNALKMSFDTLPFKNDKELFKHIACFFVGTDRDLTETILNACDINTRSGIAHLIDRCLLLIGWDNKLMMHQLVQEMGRDLVRQESPNKPWERSRLWCHEESLKGTENLLGIALDMRMLDNKNLRGSFELKTQSFSDMDNLMLLQINYVKLTGSLENFPEELRWLCMHGSLLKSIHLDTPMENLVALDMSFSNIESFNVSYSNPQPPVKRQKVTEVCSNDKRLLGSLKILDLSYCEQLHSLGGFFELPALERLIVRKCVSLIDVCRSIEQCVELILIDMSYCYKLKHVPISLGKLKKVKTLLLDGCISLESQIQRWEMNSSDINIYSQNSSIVMPTDFKFFTISLPSSLKFLSLANNNLSNESFPMDMSCLSMLEALCLDNNPIVSMPSCVRTLPRLKELIMDNCDKVISIENPPRTLRVLSVYNKSDKLFERDYKTSLRKIKFDPEMSLEVSPLKLFGVDKLILHSSFELDGIIKIQALGDVEEKIYYEFGIFSTIYEGWTMPDWISHRSNDSTISFIIPSSPKKIQGLNFYCSVETTSHISFVLPLIKITNITKDHTWIYDHYVYEVRVGGKCLSLLSHWMFGPNEMKGGDHIAITVGQKNYADGVQHTTECGISVVYEDEKVEEDEDELGYYKSWNHILDGDLSAFQITTGEYILDNNNFERYSSETFYNYFPFIEYEVTYKDAQVRFKAFSQKKSGIVDQLDCDKTILL